MKKIGLVFILCLLCHVAWAQWPLEQHDSISEVIISSQENPAIGMIRQAAERRSANSLRANKSFEYIQYQKIYALADTFTQKLFLNEYVTDVTFLKPSSQNSKVIASRTSGFKEPVISVWLASQQSPYFDEDYVSFIQSNFLNPISNKGLQCYDYTLQERIVTPTDTVFRIGFAPKRGYHFSALSGTLWLHYPDWALQRIEASAYDSTFRYPLNFDQYFVQQPNGTWAPDSLSFRLGFSQKSLQDVTVDFHGFSTFRHLNLNCPLLPKDFSRMDVEDKLSDGTLNEIILNHYRSTALTPDELRTYQLVDSISRTAHLDRAFAMLQPLSEGYIPIGPINLDFAKVIDYKNVEGWRFGVGLYTNQRFSKLVSFGGHFAYGLADHRWKGGGRIDFDFGTRWDLHLRLDGGYDLWESGGIYHYDASYAFLSAEYIRQWTVSHYDYVTGGTATFQMRPLKWLRFALNANYGIHETGFDYNFLPLTADDGPRFYFRNFETGITLQLAFKEEHLRAGSFTFFSESPYPVITLHYAKGFKNVLQSDFNYHKVDFNLRYRKNYRNNGYTEVSLWGGFTPNDLPASLLYSPMAAYAVVDFDSWEQFATMRSNDFLCDKYAFAFLRHNFGKMTNNKRFSPQIILCQNIGIGGIRHPELHKGIFFEDLSRGYFETGIIFDRLVDLLKTCSLGIGIFYHYGPYYQPKTWDNFAIKIRFSLY